MRVLIVLGIAAYLVAAFFIGVKLGAPGRRPYLTEPMWVLGDGWFFGVVPAIALPLAAALLVWIAAWVFA